MRKLFTYTCGTCTQGCRLPDPLIDQSSTDASLRNTAISYFGSGDDIDQPSEVRFLRGVARLVRKRISKPDPNEEASPAVFLLLPRVPETVSTASVNRYPMLDNGRTAVNGRLWFVGPLVNHGACVPVVANSDAALFDFVTASLDLGDVPAVVLEPRTDEPELALLRNGLNDLDSCDVIPIGRGKVWLKRRVRCNRSRSCNQTRHARCTKLGWVSMEGHGQALAS